MTPFHKAAMRALDVLCKERRYLTSDDLLDALGDTQPDDRNQIGRVWQSAKQRRLVRPTGSVVPSRRAAARGRMIQVWQSNTRRDFEGDQSLDDFIRERTGAEETTQGSLL
jgi:hypothetical protein